MASSKLEDLIERVKAATGPDRKLDLDIHCELFPDDDRTKIATGHWGDQLEWGVTEGSIWSRSEFGSSSIPLPRLTASIDAIVALIEAKLPGAKVGFDPVFFDEGHQVKWDAIICTPDWDLWSPVNSDWIARHEARHTDRVLAANLAFLQALPGDPS